MVVSYPGSGLDKVWGVSPAALCARSLRFIVVPREVEEHKRFVPCSSGLWWLLESPAISWLWNMLFSSLLLP